MMTLEQFREQREFTDDLHATLPDDVAQYFEGENGAPVKKAGYVYPACGVITVESSGRYGLVLGNVSCVNPDLSALEHALYTWLADDGALS